MKVKFAPKPVRRFYLGFDSKEEFEEALRDHREMGHIRFSTGGEDLAGTLVRASEVHLHIEVDAAADMPLPAQNPLADASRPFSQARQIYGRLFGRGRKSSG